MKSALNGVKKLVHARCEDNSGSWTPRGNNADGGESFRPRLSVEENSIFVFTKSYCALVRASLNCTVNTRRGGASQDEQQRTLGVWLLCYGESDNGRCCAASDEWLRT